MPKLSKAIFDAQQRFWKTSKVLANIAAEKAARKNFLSTPAPQFDLEKKHLFYGRIDREGNAIYLEKENLEQISAGRSTEWVADFAAEAFSDLQANYQRKTFLVKDSPYNRFLKAYKAQRSGDIAYNYSKHMQKMYVNFVQEYLSVDRRHEKIHDFNDFVREFLRYASRIAYYFPVTMTGFILSNHCSPYASGLMIDIASEPHVVANNKIPQYVNDYNYDHFVETARKFGFMVDRNAPWRIVFNVASGGKYFKKNKQTGLEEGAELVSGAAKYLANYGLEFDSVFDVYYQKSHLREIENLRKSMFDLYSSFYGQYSSYIKLRFHKSSFDGDCFVDTVKRQYENRQPLPGPDDPKSELEEMVYGDEYWLKIILHLRLAETGHQLSETSFAHHVDIVLNSNNVMGPIAGLNYINDLTKGHMDSKFIREGEYWHGQTRFKYQHRKQLAEMSKSDPSQVDLELRGSLNKKRG
tara:strand:- start:21849 stop:23252 length:1404 start_codon:yes stop_codon:yes gene_type:complete